MQNENVDLYRHIITIRLYFEIHMACLCHVLSYYKE